MAGRDEESGLDRERVSTMPSSPRRLPRCAPPSFPNSNDASARAAGRVERLPRFDGESSAPFGVHAVIRGVVGGHRQERPSPDMEA